MNQENDIAQPETWNIVTSNIVTSRPLLPKGVYSMVIKSIKCLPNKAETGHNACVVFATTKETRSTKGEPVKAGHKVRKYYPLQANPDKIDEQGYDIDRWAKDLIILSDAALKIEDVNHRSKLGDALNNSVGKTVSVCLGIEQQDGYGEVNTVSPRSIKAEHQID